MNDHNHHDHHSSGFSNGFVLGGVIGAGIVFLLGTDKGKRILKTLTENGIEGLKDILDEDFLDEEAGYDSASGEGEIIDPPASSQSKPIKRFFKGIKR